ncbi:MAG: hypothetical protein RH862_12340 [Leptospiraceae bacterium]
MELELGMGGSYYEPGLPRRLIEDAAIQESFSPYSISFPGTTQIETSSALFSFGQLDLYSNDFIFSLFFRNHYPRVTGTYFIPGTNGILLGVNNYDIEDRVQGVGFSHIFYALNDRLRFIPGYGFIGYSQYMKFKGNALSIINSTSPATVQYGRDQTDNGRTSTTSAFIGLGIEFDFSETIRLKSQIRYMPLSSGDFTLNMQSYIRETSPTSGGTTVSLLGFQVMNGKAMHSLFDIDTKIQYALSDYVQFNVGFRYERIGSKYSPNAFYAPFNATVQDNSGTTNGFLLLYSFEALTDERVYQPLGQNLGTAYFSITFRTERTNI